MGHSWCDTTNFGRYFTRSLPYEISMVDFVQRFSFSKERIGILKNFLHYRQFLYSIGFASGFQWVNGSFTEHVEILRQRPPNDIDVVSFITEPQDPPDDFEQAFDQNYIKQHYQIDGYFVELNSPPQELIKWTSYWYSMWSHQRETKLWKGFFQIRLCPQDDTLALEFLEGICTK